MAHRVGIIGLGTVGSRFVEQFSDHADFDLVAAWDPDADACRGQAGAVDIAPGPDGVIAAADVVYVAVPPLFHREYVEACVAAETAIFCEKPLGVDVVESTALVDLVEAGGLPAAVNFVFGAAPSAAGLAARIAGGEIGDVLRGDLRLHFAQWPRAWHAKAQWLRLRDQGGWIREVVSHFVFLASRVLGPVSLERAVVSFPDDDGDGDGVSCETDALARLAAGGHPVLMIGTSGGAGPDVVDFTVRGTAGSMRIWDWYRLQTATDQVWVDLLGDDRAELAAAAYAAQLGELSALLAGEPSRLATFREALAVQTVVEAILEA